MFIMENQDIEIMHSKTNMVSFGFSALSREFLLMAFNTFVFFYYEAELGLNVWYIMLALIFFAIYNAINDPLIGYLTNRPFKFTKRWGRRFPWMIIGGIPLGFSYFLIFSPPKVDPQSGPWVLFAWLLLATCLFDTCNTIFYVNFQAFFADKFRSVSERRTATGIQMILGILGVALGAMIPPLLINFGDLQSYAIQGLVVFLFGFITMILAIPGLREDRKVIDRYLATYDKEVKRESFIKSLKNAFKQKSFIAFIVLYTMYQTLVVSMTASLPYVVRFILKMEARATTLIMAALLIGSIVSTPLWVKLAHKINDNRKVILISGLLMGACTAPLIFVESYVLILIIMVFWGVSLGGFAAMILPIMGDIIDESVVRLEKREEGTLSGIEQFFGRLGIIIQALSFAIAHTLTGFVEGAETQSDLAIWGIHVHLALIPMIGILFGSFIFWKLYDLKPDKVSENQLRIKQLKL
jgi:GPH family glycoside/pentoside/hexuronide:cation symporter